MNGCNTSAFTAVGAKSGDMASLAHPIWLYVGRVSHEKNVLAFLELHSKLPGSLAIVVRGRFNSKSRCPVTVFCTDPSAWSFVVLAQQSHPSIAVRCAFRGAPRHNRVLIVFFFFGPGIE